MNMEKNHRVTVRVTDDEIRVLEKIRADNHLTDITKAIHLAIGSYQKLANENAALKEDNRKQLTRIRISSNSVDKSNQAIIELLNTMLWQRDEPGKGFTSTEAELHPYIEAAQKTVTARIARYKQIKDSKQKGKSVSTVDTLRENETEA